LNSIHKNIANQIDLKSSEQIIFPKDFRGLGSEDAIKMSLSRHVTSGKLTRIANGIYIKTKKTGKTHLPSLETIALAIAKKERIKIKPTGVFALHKLGLRSHAPNALEYITDGEPRNILIGKNRLIFKSTTPKKLRLSDGISGLIIQALEEIGKDGIDETLNNKILEQLKKEKEKILLADLQLAPAWIYNYLYKLKQHIKQ